MLGFQVDELIARPIHATLRHAHASGTKDCPILRTLREGKPQRITNTTFRRKDRSACPVDFTCTPLQRGRQIIGAVVTFTDITERKRAEEAILRHAAELERANRQLRENERYKDEFLSVISHELRTPINLIMGFSEMMDDEVIGPLNAQQHDYMRKILDGSDSILLLVNDLLDVATMQAGKFELHPVPVHYEEVVNKVLTALKPLASQKCLSLAAEMHPPIVIEIDGPRIVHALNNIVSNAIKFTPEGGSVRVNVYRHDHELVTEVSDSGIGISEEDMSKLFTRFRQLDMSTTRTAGGTGLGLSIAKALVEAHGGTISAMSPGTGKGSVFSFTLPIEERASTSPERQEDESLMGADG